MISHVKYIIENSVILKKLVLNLSGSMLEQGCRVSMDLLALSYFLDSLFLPFDKGNYQILSVPTRIMWFQIYFRFFSYFFLSI